MDTDLFLLLKARAYRHGSAGPDRLVAAVRLVRGRPFTLAKPDVRWLWAAEGEAPRDAILTTAIVDAAHTSHREIVPRVRRSHCRATGFPGTGGAST